MTLNWQKIRSHYRHERGKNHCDSPPQAFAWELFEKHNSDKRSLPQIG